MSLLTHPAIPVYQSTLAQLKAQGHITEAQTRRAFGRLLERICEERGFLFVEEYPVGKNGRKKVDGAIRDHYSSLGYWEAKDEKDALEIEIKKKIALDYPINNTIFEDTQRAFLWQNNKQVGEFNLARGEEVGALLDRFFGYTEADREGFDAAVAAFIERVPELARALLLKINDERDNARFKSAFDSFFAVCQSALNPAIREEAVKEMLVQHLLTERLFKHVFQNDEWFAHNIIAREIDAVIHALTSSKWNRADFLKSLDPFFKPIEDRARTLPDYSEKQAFLNTLYERFFQGYSTEIADTMGIVYTPQPIVDWMCASVERTLQTQWGKTLATPDVKILDPCTGTGNFVVNLMGRIPRADLPAKYERDLWANEIMLLPYYVASGNIEHTFFEKMGYHAAFEGLCFQDTLDLSHADQLGMFAEENSERIARQKAAEITVIIGNPPYNVGQQNENDNNKNRVYKGAKNEPGVDDLIKATYAKESKATLQNKLYDAYVRFFKWAEARLGERDGIICFVTNNSFVEQHAFDGMRASLAGSFDQIWHLDLHGNVRKNPKLSGTAHNVFGIQVGVGITILVRNKAARAANQRFIKYHRVPEFWRNSEKLDWLVEAVDVDGVEWQTLAPNAKNAWITEGLEADFDEFVPLGTKAAKAGKDEKTIFGSYSGGVSTNRDSFVYNFDISHLEGGLHHFINAFNMEADRWRYEGAKYTDIDAFAAASEMTLKWSRNLKREMKAGKNVVFDKATIRDALYRPFCKKHLYFDATLVDERGAWPRLSPNSDTKNPIIVVSDIGHRTPFSVLMTDCIPDLHLVSTADGTQCFPLYTFSADGSERFDNITSHAVGLVRAQFGESVSREDIFYATYALLHAPDYRAKFAENLKRELPRLPLDFFIETVLADGRLGEEISAASSESLPSAGLAPSSKQVSGNRLEEDASPALSESEQIDTSAEIDTGAGLVPSSKQVSGNRLEEGASPALSAQAKWSELVRIGRALGDLHVGYESAPPFALVNRDTTPDGVPFSFRVEKMRWRDDKATLCVNASIELSGFTAEMFDYRLGNRSALDWVVESYRVKTDARSGLVSDPNRDDDKSFVLDLIKRVATVSVETSRLVGLLPKL